MLTVENRLQRRCREKQEPSNVEKFRGMTVKVIQRGLSYIFTNRN